MREELFFGGAALRAQIGKLEFGRRGRISGGTSYISGIRNGRTHSQFQNRIATNGFRTMGSKKFMVE